jgi:hypothetical protein
MTGDDDWFSENLKKRPKLLNAHVPAEAKRWVAAIDYAEPRTWLRRGTSTQTILCAIKAAGERIVCLPRSKARARPVSRLSSASRT